MKLRDLSGQRFGKLFVLERANEPGRRVRWLCKCDCGVIKEIGADSLVHGRSQSCGCGVAEATRRRSLKHGASVGYKKNKTYKAWLHAKGRCFNPKNAKYPLYGGRGITMSEKWREDFAAFLADMGEAPENHSLDRIDVNGHYEPGNCRWATARQQGNNTRSNVPIIVNGERYTMSEFAQACGVDYKIFHALVRYQGFSPVAAVAQLVQRQSGPTVRGKA